jgi:hypothetical protein
MTFKRIRRKLDRECQFLNDEAAIRRRELEAFGVDFKAAGILTFFELDWGGMDFETIMGRRQLWLADMV